MIKMTNESIQEIRNKDKERLKSIQNSVQDVTAKAMDALERRYRDTIRNVQELNEKKGNVLRQPRDKASFLSYAAQSLKSERQIIIDGILRKHLEDCQKGYDIPFCELSMKSLFGGDKSYRLAPLLITENDIKNIIDSFDEVGVSDIERAKLIKKIDAEIDAAEAEITADANAKNIITSG